MNPSEKKITIIQPILDSPFSAQAAQRKKRVAAYARVSTDSDEQLSSYEAQVSHYTSYIQSNPQWEFVSVYTDEGITGTNLKKREGFNRMVSDALDGKIDLILTKSVSRFARNTVDTLQTIRLLKQHGIGVFFERENVDTLGANSEVFITIMSSLAQEESNSISKNVTWGKRNSMRKGKVSLPYKHFLGYRKGADDIPEIVEEEAQIIREIYRLFLNGWQYRAIARYLTDKSIRTPGGKKEWRVSTVMSILRNEKYKGSALLQKTYTVDFLSKTRKKNEGELTQFYIENSHPAIIPPETFDLVQLEMDRRKANPHQQQTDSPFAAKIICGDCGSYYGCKVWYSNTKYRKHIWRCNHRYENTVPCTTPFISEEQIKKAFLQAFNRLLGDKQDHIAEFKQLLPIISDVSDMEKQREDAQAKCDMIMGRMRRSVQENAMQVQNQEEYQRKFEYMFAEYKVAEQHQKEIQNQIRERIARVEKIERFCDELQNADQLISEFDQQLWCATVDSVTVKSDQSLVFRFRDESEMTITLPKIKKRE